MKSALRAHRVDTAGAMAASQVSLPGVRLERHFWERYPVPWAGVDEAGRGCLAGPVVAAAVILPVDFALPGLTDSKRLSAVRRDELAIAIKGQALGWSLGLSWPAEIDRINILQATFQAMRRALATLRPTPCFAAVDGPYPIPLALPQQAVVDGDAIVPAISAASILAKTYRDRLLRALDRRYPGYGFARHKGYGTREHRDAILRLGPCRQHRLTFRGAGADQARSSEPRTSCLPGI